MFSKSTFLFDCDCNTEQRLSELKSAMQRTLMKPKKDINCNNRKQSKPLEVRKEEVMAIKNRFPTKIPVIVTRYPRESYLPKLDKSKFLVPQEITMTQFMSVLRNRMKIKSSKSLYVLINDKTLITLSQTMSAIYSEHAGPDGFLYLTYASQEVFGSCELKCVIFNPHRSRFPKI